MVNMENSAGDFNREKGKLLASAKNSNQDEETSDIIFQHFHEQYLKLKSLTSNNAEENSRANPESRILLEYMIEELNKRIKSNGEKHEFFFRLLGMKIFLQHILSKVLSENESHALLEKLYKESKPYLSNPEVAYSGFLIINSLSALKGKLENSLEKIRDILEECQISYTKLKSTNKDDNYYSGNELFSSKKKMLSNKDAKLKYEKLVVTNLLFLGSIYEKLGDHYKDTVCYHTAFNRMLNKGLVSPYKWVDFTTRLACVFIDDNNFKDARHHLSAATHVHEMLEVRSSSINDPTKEELIKSNSIHLALAWVRYCVLLFEKSKDEDRRKFSNLFKNGYLYSNSRPIEKSIINDQYKSLFLHSKNSNLQNKVFMETINTEISDECDDYDKINNLSFEDFLDVVRCHLNETKEQENNELKMPEIDSITKKNMNEEHKTNSQYDNLNKKHEIEGNSKSKVIMNEANEKLITKGCENNKGEGEIEKFDSFNKESEKEIDETEESDHPKSESEIEELIFSSLGYLPIEQAVTKDLIQTPEQAKRLFTFAYRWSKQAQLFYPKTSDFYSYVHVILNLVSLHRLCAYFQGRDNLDYRINLEQTRENLLEHLVTELSEIQPENHLHVRLYQEMALLNIDLAMLNMCNIYNIHADDTYKLFAFAEIQSHINHIYIVGDMLERSTNIFEKKKTEETGSEEKIDSFTTSAS